MIVMIIRILLVCCTLGSCFNNQQRRISGADGGTLSNDSVEVVYGLDIANDRQEACWNETMKEHITMTVTVKKGQQIATSGNGAKATIALFDDSELIVKKEAERGLAVFEIVPDNGFEIDQYHYLEATAKINGQANVITAIGDGFAFVEECDQ